MSVHVSTHEHHELGFVRKYNVDASATRQQFWAGMITLA